MSSSEKASIKFSKPEMISPPPPHPPPPPPHPIYNVCLSLRSIYKNQLPRLNFKKEIANVKKGVTGIKKPKSQSGDLFFSSKQYQSPTLNTF